MWKLDLFVLLISTQVMAFNPNQLLEGYDPKLNPYYLNLKTLVVNITTPFVSLGTVISDEELATIFYAVNMTWTDERLRFDPAEYGNNTFLYIPTSSIWTPRYTIFNARNTKVLQNGNELDATVWNDGTVSFTQIFFSKVQCDMRLKRFPFDKFFCGLRILTLDVNRTITRYHGYKLNHGTFSSKGNIEFTLQRFNVCSVKAELVDVINDMYFMLELQRDTFYYHFVIVLPATLVTTLTVIGALLPKANDNSDDTIHVGMAALLALSITFSVIADNIPRTNIIPLIAWFVIVCLVLCLASIFCGLLFSKWKQMIKKKGTLPLFPFCLVIYWRRKSLHSKHPSRLVASEKILFRCSLIVFVLLQAMLITNLLIFFSFSWNRDTYSLLNEPEWIETYDIT